MSNSVESRRHFLRGVLPFLGAAVVVPALATDAEAGPWGFVRLGRRLFRNSNRRVYRQPVAPRYVVPPGYAAPPRYVVPPQYNAPRYYYPRPGAAPYYRPAPTNTPGSPGFR